MCSKRVVAVIATMFAVLTPAAAWVSALSIVAVAPSAAAQSGPAVPFPLRNPQSDLAAPFPLRNPRLQSRVYDTAPRQDAAAEHKVAQMGQSCSNAAGSWVVDEKEDATGCDEGKNSYRYIVNISQNKCRIILRTKAGSFSGTVEGNKVSYQGNYSEEGGRTTVKGRFIVDGQKWVRGSSSWRWSDASTSCSGSTASFGRRQ